MSAAKTQLPPPLVSPLRHPFKWTRQRTTLLGCLVIGTHIGTLMMVALYYLLFQTYEPITNLWHNVVSNDNLRHAVRNVGEGLLGGALGQMIIYSAYKRSQRKTKIGLLDKIETFLHLPNRKDGRELKAWQVVAAPLIIIIYAIPGFVLGFWVAHLIEHAFNVVQTVNPNVVHHSYWQKAVTADWPQKVVGFFASIFMGRRPIMVYANDAQLWFAQRRIKLGKTLRWYHTPVFKARYNDLIVNGAQTAPAAMSQSGWQAKLMLALVPLVLGLAGFGFHVLNDIAK